MVKKLYITIYILMISSPVYAGVNIDIDNTIFIQFAIFIVFGFIAQKLIINPIVNIIDKREELTNESLGDSKEMGDEVSDLEEEYYSEIKKIRKEVSENYREKIEVKQKENRALIENKRDEVNKNLDIFVKDISKEEKQSRKNLEEELDSMSDIIVKKVLS